MNICIWTVEPAYLHDCWHDGQYVNMCMWSMLTSMAADMMDNMWTCASGACLPPWLLTWWTICEHVQVEHAYFHGCWHDGQYVNMCMWRWLPPWLLTCMCIMIIPPWLVTCICPRCRCCWGLSGGRRTRPRRCRWALCKQSYDWFNMIPTFYNCCTFVQFEEEFQF